MGDCEKEVGKAMQGDSSASNDAMAEVKLEVKEGERERGREREYVHVGAREVEGRIFGVSVCMCARVDACMQERESSCIVSPVSCLIFIFWYLYIVVTHTQTHADRDLRGRCLLRRLRHYY
jgi:hypothetical protein